MTARVQHNKTQELTVEELPFNPKNVLLDTRDIRRIFDAHGLSGLSAREIGLYRTAFVHKSYCTMKNSGFEESNEKKPADCLPLQDVSYERLELLGDAVLGMVVARYLYERYPGQNEGFLSKMRTKLVNGRMLGSLAAKLGFGKWLVISKQIEEGGGRENYKILEDAFESFIAAIYLDFNVDTVVLDKSYRFTPLSGGGYHVAEQFIVSVLEKYIDFSELVVSRMNYKDQLVRYMHQQGDAPSFFEVRVQRDPNGSKVFTYTVKDTKSTVLGTGKGGCKKDAENEAARAALVYYGQNVE